MAWMAVPKGVSPADVSESLKTIKLVGRLTLITDFVGIGVGSIAHPFGLAWSIGSTDIPSSFFRAMTTLSAKFCGGDLFALMCHWDCVTKTRGWWPFKKKVKESEFLFCEWIKCKSPEGRLCLLLPDKHECEKRIIKIFTADTPWGKWKVHESFSKSDLKKIKKIIKKGKAEVDERPL
jgi:hypothetical protein